MKARSQSVTEQFASSEGTHLSRRAFSQVMSITRPPPPPRRNSSHHNRTLKLYSKGQLIDSHSTKSRHEQCFVTEDNVSNIRSLRERFCSNLERYQRSRECFHNAINRMSSSSPISFRDTKVSNLSSNTFYKRRSEPCLSQSKASIEKNASYISNSVRNHSSVLSFRNSQEFSAKVDDDQLTKVPLKHTSTTKEKQLLSEKTQVTTNSDALPSIKREKLRLTKKEQEKSCRRLSKSSAELSSPIEVKKIPQRHKDKETRNSKTLPSRSGVVKSSTTLYTSLSNRQKHLTDKSVKIATASSLKKQELLRKTTEQPSIIRKSSNSQLKFPKKSISSQITPKISAESKKVKITSKASQKSFTNKESLRLLTSYSEINRETNKKKRLREKPQIIVRTPTKKPETIQIGNSGKRIEAKKKLRKEKTNDNLNMNRSLNGWKRTVRKDDIKLRKTEGNIVNVTQKLPKNHDASLTVEEFKRHQEATRTDTFFQNLFLQDTLSSAQNYTVLRSTLINERTKMFQDTIRKNFRSEPSLKSFSMYLEQKRPVSNSKFKNWERESVSSRSSSPYGVYWSGRSVFQKVSKFDSLLAIDEFGSSTILDNPEFSQEHMKKRSLSEPPLKILPESKESSFRSSSPSPIRSRQICARTHNSNNISSKKVRARSAGEVEDTKKLESNLSVTTRRFGSMSLIDRKDYQQYIVELLHHKRKSERYKDLCEFYTNIGRMGQLEHAFSSGNLKPRMKDEEIIDYDRWKQIRLKEKAEQELKLLYGKLQNIQYNKDFLFNAKDINKFRWHGDSGLRCKEHSVEDILQHFKKLQSKDSELESSRRRNISLQKDAYKPFWRGSSVVDVARTIHEKANVNQNANRSPEHPFLQRRLGGSKKFWSSLSIEQVSSLKKQLNEIFGSDSLQKETLQSNDKVDEIKKNQKFIEQNQDRNKDETLSCYEIVVPHKEISRKSSQIDSKGLHVRCHSMITTNASISERNSDTIRTENILKKSDSIGRLKDVVEMTESKKSVLPSMSELEKKRLSLTLGKEVLDKVTRKKSTMLLAPRETRGSIAATLAATKVSTKTPMEITAKATSTSSTSSLASISPRTCYSLEATYAEDSTRSKEKSDFLLVLTPNKENASDKQRIETVFEEWSKKPPYLSMVLPNGNSVESITENLETSVKTMIKPSMEAEDVPRKIKFFENVEKRGEQQCETVMTENQRSKRLSSSQSFADLKELFGETESAKYGPLTTISRNNRPRSTSPREKRFDRQKDNGPSTLLKANSGTRQQSFRSCSWDREYNRSHSASPCRATTRSNSSCSLDSSSGLRSSSPDPERYWRAYLKLVRDGTVRRLRTKFESVEDLPSRRVKIVSPPKRFRSDPELARILLNRASKEGRDVLKPYEHTDVTRLRKRFEAKRERTWQRGGDPLPIPRVPLRRENLSMPHIDIISKTIQLKEPMVTSTVTNHMARQAETKELEAKKPVCRMRERFESTDVKKQTSIMGEMFTSTPDVRELRDIAPYLAGQWVAHRYPNRRDNMRSLSSPANLEVHRGSLKIKSSVNEKKKLERPRATSSSPIRSSKTPTSILKPSSQTIFDDQPFDPDKHRPRFRYQPPPPPPSPSLTGRKLGNYCWPTLPLYTARPTVTFEGLNFNNN